MTLRGLAALVEAAAGKPALRHPPVEAARVGAAAALKHVQTWRDFEGRIPGALHHAAFWEAVAASLTAFADALEGRP